MAYLGNEKPVLYYGAAYGTIWNLQTDDVNVGYSYSFETERDVYDSLGGKVWTVERDDTAGKVRFYGKIYFNNMTAAQVEKFEAILSYTSIKIKLHNDFSANDTATITCVITNQQSIAEEETNTEYPTTFSGVLNLKSEERIYHPDDTVT